MLAFLSHSSVDKPFARKLAKELEQRKVQIWLDEIEIRVGESIPEKIGEGILKADILCLLISQESSASNWVRREVNAFMPRWLKGEATILPCRIDKVEMHTLLADIKYADFSDAFETGLEQLLKAVRLREEIDLQAQLADAKNAII